MKSNIDRLKSIQAELKEVITRLEQGISTQFATLKVQVDELKKYNPTFTAPWENSKNSTHRVYRIRNVGDAILEVLKENEVMEYQDIHAAIVTAGMSYALGTIYQCINRYMYANHKNMDGFEIYHGSKNDKCGYYKAKRS
jgi:hypothetical protein